MGMLTIRRMSQRILLPVVVVIVVAMGVGLFFVGAPKIAQNASTYNATYYGPAVRVNGRTLNDKDFRNTLENLIIQASQYAQYQMPGYEINVEELREQALQQGINDLIIQDQAAKRGIRVTSAQIDRFFNMWSKQYSTQEEKSSWYMQAGFTSDRDFKERGIKPYLLAQYLDLSLIKKGDIDLKLTEAEVKQAYADANHKIDTNHILIATSSSITGYLPDAEAKKKAEEVYAKLKAGGDWDALVKEYSMDTSNKEKSGALGSLAQGSLDKSYVEAALKLEAGEYSEPVKSQYGYHIIKLNGKEGSFGAEYRKDRQFYEAQLAYQKVANDAKYTEWMEARIKEAKVEVLDPGLTAFRLKTEEKWADAAKYYDKAMSSRKHKWDREGLISAMEVLIHEKMYDKAIKFGTIFLKRFKNDPIIEANLGKAYYLRAKNDDKKQGLALIASGVKNSGTEMGYLSKIQAIYKDLNLTKKATEIELQIAKIVSDIATAQKAQQDAAAQAQQQAEQSGATGTDSTATGTDDSSGTGN